MKYQTEPGQSVHSAATKAKELAIGGNSECHFVFNGIDMFVQPTSNIGDICAIYALKQALRLARKELSGLKN